MKFTEVLLLSRFRKLQLLSAHERRLLVQAFVLLPVTFLGVNVLGVSRWYRCLATLASLGTNFNRSPKYSGGVVPGGALVITERAAVGQARVIAHLVKIAVERGFYNARCLQQTLVLWYLLKQSHIESEIRFGARKLAGELQAHAWIEVGGIALNEESEVCLHFAPLESDARSGLFQRIGTVR